MRFRGQGMDEAAGGNAEEVAGGSVSIVLAAYRAHS
jgi:hypothetical protein